MQGLGAGAVWTPALSELSVLEKPRAIVVLIYTMAGKQTALATARSAMKAILTHF